MIRQSKATKRNFLTGEAIEIIKEKPLKSVRGVHTIELFDALTGKLVERVESENFISKVMEELQRQAALLAFLTDSISLSGSYIQYNGPLYDLAKYNVVFDNADMSWVTSGSFPMSWLVLTDYDGPEDPENEIIMRGRIVGYASRYSTYAGSDTKRGSLNTAESFIESRHIHLVYDWPTHAANGTFQSVYWNSRADENNSIGVVGKKYLQISAPNGYLFIDKQARVKSGKLYFMGKEGQTNKVAILVYDLNIQAQTITNGQVYALLNTTSTYDDFEIAPNGDIYLISGSNLYCFGQNGSPKNIPGTSQTYRYYSGYLLDLFCIAGQDVYMESRTNYNDDIKIDRYNINNLVNPLDTKVIPRNTIDAYQRYCYGAQYIPDLNMLVMNIYGYAFFVDRTTLNFSKDTPVKTSIGSNSAITYDPIKKRFIEIRHTTPYANGQYDYTKRDVTIQPLGFMGARNLLPSPVTKTSTNTMKLTYDLYIDSY